MEAGLSPPMIHNCCKCSVFAAVPQIRNKRDSFPLHHLEQQVQDRDAYLIFIGLFVSQLQPKDSDSRRD
jgi:hypothetical protein